MRQANRESVLSLVRTRSPIARVEIAEATGLTRPTVSDIVAELITEGWVREAGPAEGGVGRPAVLLEFVPDARMVLGIHVGITRVRVGLFDTNAECRQRTERVLGADRGVLTVVEQIGQAVQAVLEHSHVDPARILGAGVGLHGLVDAATGISRFAPHFGWRDEPVARLIASRIGMPVSIDNDVRAMALGESRFGAGRTDGTLVCVNVGTGIGAGIVLDGKPLHGMHGAAGEFGHTKVEPGGRLCSCGGRGCLETVASGPAIAARAAERLAGGEPSLLQANGLSGEEICRTAEAGDRLAAAVLAEAGGYLGLALANLVNLLNPEAIVVGGGLSSAGEWLFGPLREGLRLHALPGLTEGLRVIPVGRGADAGMVGAAALMLQSINTMGGVQR